MLLGIVAIIDYKYSSGRMSSEMKFKPMKYCNSKKFKRNKPGKISNIGQKEHFFEELLNV